MFCESLCACVCVPLISSLFSELVLYVCERLFAVTKQNKHKHTPRENGWKWRWRKMKIKGKPNGNKYISIELFIIFFLSLSLLKKTYIYLSSLHFCMISRKN